MWRPRGRREGDKNTGMVTYHPRKHHWDDDISVPGQMMPRRQKMPGGERRWGHEERRGGTSDYFSRMIHNYIFPEVFGPIPLGLQAL